MKFETGSFITSPEKEVEGTKLNPDAIRRYLDVDGGTVTVSTVVASTTILVPSRVHILCILWLLIVSRWRSLRYIVRGIETRLRHHSTL